MAEEEAQQDRTEQPTPKRREDARKKGDVPRSRELTMTGVMLSGAGAMLLMSGPIGTDLLQSFASGFTIERELLLDERYLVPALVQIGTQGFLSLLPLVVVLLAAAFRLNDQPPIAAALRKTAASKTTASGSTLINPCEPICTRAGTR